MNVRYRYAGEDVAPLPVEKYVGLAGAGGIAAPVGTRFRVEVFGLLGIHHTWGVDSATPDYDTDGASATQPYAGVRGYAGMRFGHFTLGLSPFVESEIGRPAKTYSAAQTFQFANGTSGSGGAPSDKLTATVGSARAGILLALGAEL